MTHVLTDPDLDERLRREGYVVLPLLTANDVSRLLDLWRDLARRYRPEWDPTGMAATVRHPGLADEADAAIRPIVGDALGDRLVGLMPFRSAYLVKRPGSLALPAHLDWRLVDERKSQSYGCWVPLTPANEATGALGVVPRSHLWVDFDRTPERPGHEWVAALVDDGADLQLLDVPAGGAVLYDHRLVHFSTANSSATDRVAINTGIAPTARRNEARGRLLALMSRAMGDDPDLRQIPSDEQVGEPVHAEPPTGRSVIGTPVAATPEAPPASPPPAPDPTRECSGFLQDPAVREALARDGFAIIGPVLGESEIASLLQLLDQVLATMSEPLPQHFFTTGMLAEDQKRIDVFDAVGRVILPLLRPLVMDDVEVVAGNFHLNPANSRGGLGPHQDVSLVTEPVESSLNGWIPLQHSDVRNGTLQVVPGSHQLANHDRSLAAPWAFDGLHELFWEYAAPLDVPAGHLVVFDTALVHCSGPNESPDLRPAVNCLFLRRGAPIRHLVADGGHVDVYDIDLDFLLSARLDGRPSTEEGRHVERRQLRLPSRDEAVLREILDAARSSAVAAGSVDRDGVGHSMSAPATDLDRSAPDGGPKALDQDPTSRARPWWGRIIGRTE